MPRRILTLLWVVFAMVGVAQVGCEKESERRSAQKEIAKIGMTKTKIEKAMGYLEEYANKFQEYPTEEEGGLKALVQKPAYHQPEKDSLWRDFCSADELKDAWGNDLRYKLDEVQSGNTTKKVPRMWSVGPNGLDENGEGDDIKNHKWGQETSQAP
jgi:hypothetical protein